MAGEPGKPYIIAARSFGHTWHDIRVRQAMRNIIAAIILPIARTFGMMVGELVLVEWFFNWPDLGRYWLQPGTGGAETQPAMFLDPPISH